jgi:hypothetical protein
VAGDSGFTPKAASEAASGDLSGYGRPGGCADDDVRGGQAGLQIGVGVLDAAQDTEFPGDAGHTAAGQNERALHRASLGLAGRRHPAAAGAAGRKETLIAAADGVKTINSPSFAIASASRVS